MFSGKEERQQLFLDQLITYFGLLFLVGGCNNQMTHKYSMETLEKILCLNNIFTVYCTAVIFQRTFNAKNNFRASQS